MYVTERCVFKLIEEGLKITEIAPGVSLKEDILNKIPFKPLVANELKTMDKELFEIDN